MLHNPIPEPVQVRYRCRNPRCSDKLKTPVAHPRDAFCCETCHEAYYRTHCRVCEQLFSRKTRRREVCGRSRCRHEFQRRPERFWGARYPRQALGHNAEKKLAKSTLKTGAKSGRGWLQIAGAKLSPRSFAAATSPVEIPTSAANLAFAEYWAETLRRAARDCRFKKNTPPVNVVGGYRFPGAPKIDFASLSPKPPSEKLPVVPSAADDLTIPGDLSIPEFLRRTDKIGGWR